jgi:hypothetical protein
MIGETGPSDPISFFSKLFPVRGLAIAVHFGSVNVPLWLLQN